MSETVQNIFKEEYTEVWRLSLFKYAKYDTPPYFTYWRLTVWLDHEPDASDLDRYSIELEVEAGLEAEMEGWELSSSTKTEVEQLYPGEGQNIELDSPRLSKSAGSLPAEGYVGFRQTRLHGFDGGVMED